MTGEAASQFDRAGQGHPRRGACPIRRGRRQGAGFTLLELLVVVTMIAILLSILLPSLSSARSRMKKLKCSSNLRTVAFEFQLYAEGNTPGGQGDSQVLGPNRFYINDFLDYLYRIDEYWDVPGVATATMKASREAMLCPAGASQLTRRAGLPCSRAAIEPPEAVTLGANMRLYRATVEFLGRLVLAPAAATRVRVDVLQHPYVPLLMDVDGEAAVRRGLEPFYAAPPPAVDDEGPYSDGRYWFPSKRHGGYTNVVFVGGHVSSSQHPGAEQWDWVYQAEVRR